MPRDGPALLPGRVGEAPESSRGPHYSPQQDFSHQVHWVQVSFSSPALVHSVLEKDTSGLMFNELWTQPLDMI